MLLRLVNSAIPPFYLLVFELFCGCCKAVGRSDDAVSVERLEDRGKQGDGTCILRSYWQAGQTREVRGVAS